MSFEGDCCFTWLNESLLGNDFYSVSCRIFIVWCPLKSSTGVEWLKKSQKMPGGNLFLNLCRFEYHNVLMGKLGKFIHGTFYECCSMQPVWYVKGSSKQRRKIFLSCSDIFCGKLKFVGWNKIMLGSDFHVAFYRIVSLGPWKTSKNGVKLGKY